jgi:hypothetical protein
MPHDVIALRDTRRPTIPGTSDASDLVSVREVPGPSHVDHEALPGHELSRRHKCQRRSWVARTPTRSRRPVRRKSFANCSRWYLASDSITVWKYGCMVSSSCSSPAISTLRC